MYVNKFIYIENVTLVHVDSELASSSDVLARVSTVSSQVLRHLKSSLKADIVSSYLRMGILR